MASFSWKRKAGEKVSKAAARLFEAEAEASDDGTDGDNVDWLHAIKRKREVLLEDCAAKSKRMKDEGAILAEQGRHWEALNRWEEAIQLTPGDATLYEMKAQVLSNLQEVFPAVQAAEMAAKLRPLWWEAWQTLGRAQLGLGEVDLAVRSFQVAIHLCPAERSLWEEDLAWASKLQERSREMREEVRRGEEARREQEEVHQQLLSAPELIPDYDFESDEVVAACTAVAERQKRYNELRKDAVVVDTNGMTQAMPESTKHLSPPHNLLVKARVP